MDQLQFESLERLAAELEQHRRLRDEFEEELSESSTWTCAFERRMRAAISFHQQRINRLAPLVRRLQEQVR